MCNANPQFIKYALRLKKNVYQDGNVLNGNIAGYINSSIGREEEANVQWDYVSLPILWNPKRLGICLDRGNKGHRGRRRVIYVLPIEFNANGA